MALQTATSSTDTAAPTSTDAGSSTDSNPADLNSKNSVPFSFLIAFLALFVVFMGLGLWARRIVFFARRRLGLPVPEPPPRQRDIRSRKPVLWDVYPDKQAQSERWASIEPLSTWYCRDAPPPPVNQAIHVEPPSWPPGPPIQPSLTHGPARAIPLTPAPLPPPSDLTPRGIRDRFLPLPHMREWWLDLINPMRNASPKCTESGKGKIDSLQVAVFVAMPFRPTGKQQGLEQLGEMAIGIAETRWEHDDSVLESEETRT